MPEAASKPTPSLEESASALVSSPDIDLNSLAAAALEDLETPRPVAPSPSAAQEALPAGAPSPDLADAVQRLIQAAPPDAAPAAPAAEGADKIEDLDAQIATIADDLIAGDFADEQGTLKGQVAAPPSAVEPPRAAETAPLPPAPPSEPVEAIPPPQIEPIPAKPSPAPPPSVRSKDRRKLDAAGPKAEPPARPRVSANLGRTGLGLLALVSAPIRNRPKSFRDTVGWVALVTLFNASCLWMYVLFFRSATPPPAKAVAAVARDGGKDSHGSGAKSDAGTKADSHAKADAKGGHGASDKKKAPAKTAAKKPAKKESKAQASHGGGH